MRVEYGHHQYVCLYVEKLAATYLREVLRVNATASDSVVKQTSCHETGQNPELDINEQTHI